MYKVQKDGENYCFENGRTLDVQTALPDVFTRYDGTGVQNPRDWFENRAYLKAMLSHYLYGRYPRIPHPEDISKTLLYSRDIFGGKGIEEGYHLSWFDGLTVELRICRPSGGKHYPTVFNINFNGRERSFLEIEEEYVCAKRYAFVHINRTLLAPDDAHGRNVAMLSRYRDDCLGAVAMWASSASAALSAVSDMEFFARGRAVVTGHSRNGKAALCAGVYDERFMVVMPNCSGCGGTGSFHILGENCETLDRITSHFPHWFSDHLDEFKGEEGHRRLPFDMHFACALIAPRAVISTVAEEDVWANPQGTYAMWHAADKVYDLLRVRQRNAIYMRPGVHCHSMEDFRAQLEFCDLVFYNKKPVRELFTNRFPDIINRMGI